MAEEEQAGPGTVLEEQDQDSGWVAEEWAEAAARGPAREARAEEAGRVRAAVCGIAALVEVVARVAGSAQVRVEDPEAARARVEVEEAAPAEAGEPVAVRGEVARVGAVEERVRVGAEDLAEVAVLAQVEELEEA